MTVKTVAYSCNFVFCFFRKRVFQVLCNYFVTIFNYVSNNKVHKIGN